MPPGSQTTVPNQLSFASPDRALSDCDQDLEDIQTNAWWGKTCHRCLRGTGASLPIPSRDHVLTILQMSERVIVCGLDNGTLLSLGAEVRILFRERQVCFG